MKIKKNQIYALYLTLFFLMNSPPGFTTGYSDDQDWPIERPTVMLGLGEQRIIRIENLAKYSVSGQSFRILPFPNRNHGRNSLLLKGTRKGLGDLWVWKTDGSSEHRTISVQPWDAHQIPKPLMKALNTLEESEVIFSGESTVLRGVIQSQKEALKIQQLRKEFEKQVNDQTQLAPNLVEIGKKNLIETVEKLNLQSTLTVEKVGNSLVVLGTLKQNRHTIERQLRAAFPVFDFQVDSLSTADPTVFFRVYLLEIKRNEFQSLGIDWLPTEGLPMRAIPWRIDGQPSFDLALNALAGNGSARVLANPQLVVRAPGEAKFFAGGELPIRQKTRLQSEVIWKSYGLSLNLNIKEKTSEQIRLDILTEISHLDVSLEHDDVPGIRISRMNTQVDANFGRPLLLCGLLQEDTRTQARGIPILREIPVLGALFGSDDYINQKSELVAVLIPNKQPPPPPLHRLTEAFPLGPVPPPRNWITPDEEAALKQSPDYPWNAL